MFDRPLPLLAALAMTLLFAPPPARAVTIDRPPLDSMLRQAGFILDAQVIAVDSDRGSSSVGPRTRVTTRVVHVLAGHGATPGDRFVFELPEGRMPDGRFVVLAGAPRLAPGERYLLFFRAGGWYHTPFVGWGHGVLRRSVDGFWVDGHGRCVVGLTRSGIQVGPRVASPAPVAPGWMEPAGHAFDADDGLDSTSGACLTAESVTAALSRRLLEMKQPPAAPVELHPRPGGWVQSGRKP